MAERSYNGRNIYTPLIDGATGDIARTSSGYIEADTYKLYANVIASGVSAEFDSSVVRSNRLSLKLSTTNATGRARAGFAASATSGGLVTVSDMAYLPKAKPVSTYKFSIWAKTNNVTTGGCYVTVASTSGNGTTTIVMLTTTKLTGTNDWTELSGQFTTLKDTEALRVIFFNDVAGNVSDAWFDVGSMQITEVLPARTLATSRRSARFMGGSTQFNGTTSTIPTTLTDNTSFTSGFVLHGWIKSRSLGGSNNGRIFDKSTGTDGENGFRLRMGNSTPSSLNFGVNLGSQRTTATILNTRNNPFFHFICHVASDATVSFYINGVLSGTPGTTGALSGITTTNPLTIGNRSGATDRAFDGNLAELGIISLAGRDDLTADEIVALYTNSTRPTGAAHFWKLNEEPSTYTDSIGGNTGTGASTALIPDTPVQARVAVRDMGTALKFAPLTTDKVLIATSASLNTISTETTIAMWVYRTSSQTSANEYLLSDTSNKWFYRIDSLTGGLLRFYYNGVNSIFNGPKLPFGWSYIVTTLAFNGTNITGKMYVNGTLVTNSNATGTSVAITGGGIRIGNDSGSTSFRGIIDEPRIWNRALTADEIKNLYLHGAVPRNGLVGEHLFDEASGTTALDTSGNGNDGTITGATYTTDTPLRPRTSV